MKGSDWEEVSEALDRWILDIEGIEEGAAILVEGKKDTYSLRSLGIGGDIREMNVGLPILDLLEHMKRGTGPFEERPRIKKLIILVDWDRKGDRLASMLEQYCRSVELECDLEFRRRLSMITRRWIVDVESIDSIYRNLKQGKLKP
ncbi:MAG: hypothetical protein ACMUIG_02765 [Thermoplasmatota archaeon]